MRTTIIILICLVLPQIGCAGGTGAFEKERQMMIDKQIKARGIKDPEVLRALGSVKRHLFVPDSLEVVAYADRPLPIGHGQTISQPYIVAYMTEAAGLKETDKVLEIGTGSGYQAAVLAEIVERVYSIEIIKALAETANQRLKELGYSNIIVKHGDGYQGWEEHAPFDVIIITAAPDKVPPRLIEQLKEGGRMIVPVGSVFQELMRITKTNNGVKKERLLPVRFVPMVGSE